MIILVDILQMFCKHFRKGDGFHSLGCFVALWGFISWEFCTESLSSNFSKIYEKQDLATVAVVLPPGVGYTNVSYRVAGDGSMFQLSVDWPNEIIETDLMHREWLKPKEEPPKKRRNDPEITGFLHFGNMHFEIFGNAKLQCTLQIALHKIFETHLAMEANLGWKDSAYTTLRAPAYIAKRFPWLKLDRFTVASVSVKNILDSRNRIRELL